MTVISGVARDVTGTGQPGRRVKASLVAASSAIAPEHGGGQIILPKAIESGEGGAWELDLVPINHLAVSTGAYYVIEVGGQSYYCTVPDEANPDSEDGAYDLGDVLVEPGPLPPTGATTAAVQAIADDLEVHEVATEDVHGIADTNTLVTAAAAFADGSYIRAAGAGRGVEGRTAEQVRSDLSLGEAALLNVGTTAGTVAAGDDPRLSDARTPTAHAASHASDGTDPVTPASIGAVALAGDSTIAGDLTIADPGVKAYRLRRSGGALDFEGTGQSMFFSVWSGAEFDGTQRIYLVLEDGDSVAQVINRWEWRTAPFGPAVHTISANDGIGFFGAAPSASAPAVTGNPGEDLAAVVSSLITALSTLGLIDDQTTT